MSNVTFIGHTAKLKVQTYGLPEVKFSYNGTQYKITGLPPNTYEITVNVPE